MPDFQADPLTAACSLERLHARGSDMPAALAADAARVRVHYSKRGEDLAPDAEAEAAAQRCVEQFAFFLRTIFTPGAEQDPKKPSEWRPTGKADGVIYLGAAYLDGSTGQRGEFRGAAPVPPPAPAEGEAPEGEKPVEWLMTNALGVERSASACPRAMRYVAPLGGIGVEGPRERLGLACPKFETVAAYVPAVRRLADEIRAAALLDDDRSVARPVWCWFTANRRGIDCIQPAYAERWHCVRLEPDVWGLVWI